MDKVMKKNRSIRNWLLLQHFVIIVLTVVLFECVFFFSLYQYYYKNTEEILTTHAKNSVRFAMRSTDLSPYNLSYTIPEMIKDYQMSGAEMQIVSPSGNVLASSSGFSHYQTIDSKELQEATIENPGIWKGKNPGTDERVMASTVPLTYEDEAVVYFRYITSLEKIDKFVLRQMGIALSIGGAIILVVLLLSMAFAKKITTPLSHLTNASKRFATGEFGTSISDNYIGELGTLAKSFNEMSHALLQHEKMKNQFISSISHELRTPLTSIKGWGDTLLTGDLADKTETRQGIQIITKETERLAQLVEDLLDFSGLNNESFSIQPYSFNIEQLIEEVAMQFQKQVNKNNITLEINLSDKVNLFADRNRIKQVMINLVDNAIKHSTPGCTIKINGIVEEGFYIITIEDEGEGIATEDLPHITSPFYKAKQNKTGAGLGLAICKNIVELHHGQLIIKSKYGEGTKVTIKIPYESSCQ